MKAWRKSRPDLFPDILGLSVEDGERWQEMRSLVQQDMMRLKSAMYYLSQLQEAADDFVNLIRKDLEKGDGVHNRY